MTLGTVGEVVSAEVAAGVVSEAEASEESSSGGMTVGATAAVAGHFFVELSRVTRNYISVKVLCEFYTQSSFSNCSRTNNSN